jgi:hypothetical protein
MLRSCFAISRWVGHPSKNGVEVIAMTQSADSNGDFFHIVLAVVGIDLTFDGIFTFLHDRTNPLIGIWQTVELVWATLPLTVTVVIVAAILLDRDIGWRGKVVAPLVMFLGFPLLMHLIHLDSRLPGGRLAVLPNFSSGLQFITAWASVTAAWYYHGYGPVLFFKSCVLGITSGAKLAAYD